jgi:hypothetical protein
MLEGMAACKFTTLAGLYPPTIFMAMMSKDFGYEIQGWVFRLSEENPYIARCFINDEKVQKKPLYE